QVINNLPPQQMVRLGVARTFQNIRLLGSLTALENVMLGAYTGSDFDSLAGHSSSELASTRGSASGRRALGALRWLDQGHEQQAAAYALDLLDMLGLGSYADRPAASLSYGDQRRLEIARALASNPTILLLDEPAAGMNATEAAALGQLLRKLCEQLGK